MSTSPQVGRRLKAFRLTDLPESVRWTAANRLIKQEENLVKRLQLGAAAENPSAKLYHVSCEAWERVMRPRKRRGSS